MLTRIELTNFMSHAHTVIEPAAGLTVLVGPNNCGKSALVAALQILCTNDKSNYVLRHGQRECSVELETAEGHVVRWTRKTSPSYRINGQLFDRLRGAGLPDELHQSLRLSPVDSGEGTTFDIHFGCQKSPIFLLNEPPSAAAKFFASSSDAIRLVEMQRRHREKHAEKQREKTRLEGESKQLNAELQALQPAAELDHQLKTAEALHQELLQLAAAVSQLESESSRFVQQKTIVAHYQAQTQAVGSVVPPPQLAPVAEVQSHISKIESLANHFAHSADQAAALRILSAPPRLKDTTSPASHVARLDSLQQSVHQTQQRRQSLSSLASPPALAETAVLKSLVQRLHETSNAAVQESTRARSLHALAPPLPPADERHLSSLVAALSAAQRNLDRATAAASAVHRLPIALAQDSTEPLHQLHAGLKSLTDLEGSLINQHKQLMVEQVSVASKLRELASGTLCPTCGAPLDADRLLAHATTHGGPTHG